MVPNGKNLQSKALAFVSDNFASPKMFMHKTKFDFVPATFLHYHADKFKRHCFMQNIFLTKKQGLR